MLHKGPGRVKPRRPPSVRSLHGAKLSGPGSGWMQQGGWYSDAAMLRGAGKPVEVSDAAVGGRWGRGPS